MSDIDYEKLKAQNIKLREACRLAERAFCNNDYDSDAPPAIALAAIRAVLAETE